MKRGILKLATWLIGLSLIIVFHSFSQFFTSFSLEEKNIHELLSTRNFIQVQPAFAQEQSPSSPTRPSSTFFDTSLDTTVVVSDGGQSRVTHEFTITNKTPTTFISQYGLKISSNQLKNITVLSDGQLITPEINYLTPSAGGPGQTSIGITFPDKVVGEGKSRTFTISYTHPDIAIISGSVLEIALPPQANPDDYQKYSVTLITPGKFDGPVRTTPSNNTFSVNNGQVITTFGKEGIDGIFALFGSTQLFNLDLTYHLTNDTSSAGITQIALPPDTAYQRMFYRLLEPKPQKLEYDADGNWIATYQISAGTDTTVHAQALVQLSLEPSSNVPMPSPNTALLDAQSYWPVQNSDIQSLATKYQSPAEINNFVVDTLSYNTERALNKPERLGATEALARPDQAVCQEFTDVFIAIARAAQIPARRITGYAYTQNSDLRPLSLVDDVLHAWPEYYDQASGRWIPIDPTWESTTGGVDYFHQVDLSHIVFAINGHNSVTPYPAGSYKAADTAEKTVQVSFATEPEFPEPKVETSLEVIPQKLLGISIPGRYTLELTNHTGWAAYDVPIELTADHSLLGITNSTGTIPTVLPFQTIKIPLHLQNNRGILPQHDTIRITINHDEYQFELTSGPKLSESLNTLQKTASQFIQQQPYLALGLAAFFIAGALFAGSLLVFKR